MARDLSFGRGGDVRSEEPRDTLAAPDWLEKLEASSAVHLRADGGTAPSLPSVIHRSSLS